MTYCNQNFFFTKNSLKLTKKLIYFWFLKNVSFLGILLKNSFLKPYQVNQGVLTVNYSTLSNELFNLRFEKILKTFLKKDYHFYQLNVAKGFQFWTLKYLILIFKNIGTLPTTINVRSENLLFNQYCLTLKVTNIFIAKRIYKFFLFKNLYYLFLVDYYPNKHFFLKNFPFLDSYMYLFKYLNSHLFKTFAF